MLHVWNSGISCTLSKYMDRIYGTDSKVIHRARYNPWGHSYCADLVEGAMQLRVKALVEGARSDVIHVHSVDEFLPLLRRLRKPLVMHYHGSEIRGNWEKRRPRWRHADAILCSTQNILQDAPPEAVHLPNPVDPEMFRVEDKEPARDAFTFSYGADDLAGKLAEDNSLTLDIIQRTVPWKDTPKLYRSYRNYIDVKRVNGKEVIFKKGDYGSLAGLEALACGCTVITPQAKYVGYPEKHRINRVCEKLHQLYRSLTK